MEQIPTEVKDKINDACIEHSCFLPSRETFAKGAEFGYRLLCEGKEKEIAALQEEVAEDSSIIYNQVLQIASLEAENERLKGLIEKKDDIGMEDGEKRIARGEDGWG